MTLENNFTFISLFPHLQNRKKNVFTLQDVVGIFLSKGYKFYKCKFLKTTLIAGRKLGIKTQRTSLLGYL